MIRILIADGNGEIERVLEAVRRVDAMAGTLEERPRGDIACRFVAWLRSDQSAAVLADPSACCDVRVIAASPFWLAKDRDRRRFRWSRRERAAAMRLGLLETESSDA